MSTFLLKDRKSIYTRIFILKALRTFFGERVEVWKSLRTKDQEGASYLSLKWKIKAKRLFRTLSVVPGVAGLLLVAGRAKT